jgi:hypothetical protein
MNKVQQSHMRKLRRQTDLVDLLPAVLGPRFWWPVLVCCLSAAIGCSTQRAVLDLSRADFRAGTMVETLNALRNDICAKYGFRNGAPRVNLGPCGRFARDFRERWNVRFYDSVTIVFVMANNDASNCYHVLVKLPKGQYFDGGNGVMTAAFLGTLYPDSNIEEMKNFDLDLLNKRSYGLGRTYPECPNYSDEFTQQAIENRLSELLDKQRPQ